MIIGLIGLEGGVGASTLAVNLATYLAERYDDVTLVEGEETGYNSLDYWGEARQSEIPFGVIRVAGEDIQQAECENLREYLMYNTGTHNDVIVLDVNRFQHELRRLTLHASDVILIPLSRGVRLAGKATQQLRAIQAMIAQTTEAPDTSKISETSENDQGLVFSKAKPTKALTRVSVDLPTELHLRLKRQCLRHGITMQDEIVALIQRHVESSSEMEQALPKRPHLPVRLLKNMDFVHGETQLYKDWGFPFMSTEMNDRDAVRVAFDKGLGITEYEPQGPAAHELRQLVDEIMELPAHS